MLFLEKMLQDWVGTVYKNIAGQVAQKALKKSRVHIFNGIQKYLFELFKGQGAYNIPDEPPLFGPIARLLRRIVHKRFQYYVPRDPLFFEFLNPTTPIYRATLCWHRLTKMPGKETVDG
jgi:hypothetical protein